MQEKQPLILTLRLDFKSQAYFDAQRALYFPPERNFLTAHLTLFHHLPNVDATHAYIANLKYPAFVLQISGLMLLGAGVAYSIESPSLQRIHRRLSVHFSSMLTRQDLQPFRPHITIMNKSTPEKACSLHASLTATFKPFTAEGIGIDTWTYLGGPWRFEHTVYFLKV